MVASPARRWSLPSGLHGPVRLVCCAILMIVQLGIAAAQTAPVSLLAPPDTSNPRATFQNFRSSVDQATALLLDAYHGNSRDGGLFWSEDVKAKVARAEALFAR